eukprot:g4536.t1
MESCQKLEISGSSLFEADGLDIEKKAAFICRSFGAGSEQYRVFLDDVNASLFGELYDLPKFVPGDIKGSAQSKKNKKRRQKINRPPLPRSPLSVQKITPRQINKTEQESVPMTPTAESTTPVQQTSPEANPSPSPPLPAPLFVEAAVNPAIQAGLELKREKPVLTKTLTQVERKRGEDSEDPERILRRTQSTFPSEQVTMDEQVALQLQSLLREKAELLKENSRLRNENAGLHELLEYATCEATEDDGQYSEQEELITKDSIRCSIIQAWHPTELICAPDSASSFGVASSSSTEEKEAHVAVSQILPGSLKFL